MAINLKDVSVLEAKAEHVSDWTKVFMNGIENCRWMSHHLKQQKISEMDVSLSFLEDINKKNENELFLLAYFSQMPIGIIRFEEYWIPKAIKIVSHFPLVIPRAQRQGIGKLLVREGIKKSLKKGYADIWAECWSMDKKEIITYQFFYEKIGFKTKSNRLEMACSLKDFKGKENLEVYFLKTKITNEINEELVEAISKAYADSLDKLHKIENLGNPKITREFLEKTRKTFESVNFKVHSVIAKIENKLCAGMLTATSKQKGMILEIGVIPKYRNKKIANFLISNYLIDMKKTGINEVLLGVDEENTLAIHLYEKLGFKKTWNGILMCFEDEKKLAKNE